MSPGGHTISAVYNGGSTFGGSVSSDLIQNVVAATSTTVNSSINPTVTGQPVTFTATVAAPPGAGTPDGTVTFLDSGTILGTTTLSGGTANFTNAVLALGNDTITVSYAGDSAYSASTSAAITQTVNQPNIVPGTVVATTTADLIADINAANAGTGPSTIQLQAADATNGFDFTSAYPSTNDALPQIAGAGHIEGTSGFDNTIQRSTASGTPSFRLFEVAGGVTLTLQNLTLTGGVAFGSGTAAEGGAIYSAGPLTLSGVTVQSNVAQGSNGANAFGPFGGTGGNGANANGGGLYVAGGPSHFPTITSTTIWPRPAMAAMAATALMAAGVGTAALLMAAACSWPEAMSLSPTPRSPTTRQWAAGAATAAMKFELNFPTEWPATVGAAAMPRAAACTYFQASPSWGTAPPPFPVTQRRRAAGGSAGIAVFDGVYGFLGFNGQNGTAGTATFADIAANSPGFGNYTVNVVTSTPTVTVTDGGTYNGQPFNAVGSAVGTDGHTSVSGSFSYTYYASDGVTQSAAHPRTRAVTMSRPPSPAATPTTPMQARRDELHHRHGHADGERQPREITYGTALANGQLSGTATCTVGGNSVTVPGTFTYTSAAGPSWRRQRPERGRHLHPQRQHRLRHGLHHGDRQRRPGHANGERQPR